ncbi:DUF6193 family natural product biosynthesis protein [Streptomyces sp. NRRL WC-3549]|uniref:DUF6193 family natural product biosynthesis protein n=1 Tax=Streptomyces sp. NRRL WC-3549 TaxID=1463925 RepID=UPI0009EB8B96|nr:DUF6193 family natural product biosynthesis protein [Streptomyces sp. NRRL WC-3549]
MASNEEVRSAAEIVAAKWSDVLSCEPDLINPEVPRTAYAHPSLRQLHPMLSHGALYLSRCTQWPWTHDVGTAYRLAEGGYRVCLDSGRTVLGEVDTVEEAYELVAANLPDGCGPAIDGTPDDL